MDGLGELLDTRRGDLFIPKIGAGVWFGGWTMKPGWLGQIFGKGKVGLWGEADSTSRVLSKKERNRRKVRNKMARLSRRRKRRK